MFYLRQQSIPLVALNVAIERRNLAAHSRGNDMHTSRLLIEPGHARYYSDLSDYADEWTDRCAPRRYRAALKARYGDDYRAAGEHTERLVASQWDDAMAPSEFRKLRNFS